jgi:lipopolysaccharide/colanic/teichoic acid biosynthesis glycosyltransferase
LYLTYKRLLDFVLVSVLLIAALPVMLLIAGLIVIDTHGSVFFVQDRVGARARRARGRTIWETRTFRLYKFRSMVRGADQTVHEAHIRAFVDGRILSSNGSGNFKLTHDPRVTRVGRLLRKTSLDELPQLFNVLKGDMSLVGPRPVPVYEVEAYRDVHYERLTVLPGITGLWQVRGRCALPFDEMMRLDIEYVRTCSLSRDLKILFLTVPAILTARGAG